MSFLPIGFAANLILCRLRNERRIADASAADQSQGREDYEEEEKVRADLERVDKRLALLRARVGEN